MPFTPSHAVVAIPFARSALPAVGVAAGAMAPDLPLFLPGGVGYPLTHQLPSFPLSGLALGLILVIAWRVVLRPWVPALVPRSLARRLPSDWDGSWRDGLASLPRSVTTTLLLLAAVEIGAITHVVWDEFSHVSRLGGRLLPALDADGPLHIAWASWVQYASSALGLAGLVVWVLLWLHRRAPRGDVGAPDERGRLDRRTDLDGDRPSDGVTRLDRRIAAAVWVVVVATASLGAVLDAVRASAEGEARIDVLVAVLTGGIGAGVLALTLSTLLLSAVGSRLPGGVGGGAGVRRSGPR